MATRQISALQLTELFGCLTEVQLAEIGQQVQELHFKHGEMMFLAGEPGRGLFVVVRGKVRVFQNNADGREQVMHLDSEGAVIGAVPVFDDGCYPASAFCKTDVDALFIDKGDMRRFCTQYPQLALRALRQMAELVRKHAQLVEVLCFHEVGQRLALFLLSEGQCVRATDKNRITFQLVLSNHEIANRIGSVRDVVSRAFARLEHDGLIVKRGQMLNIPNRMTLKLYADNARKHGKVALPRSGPQ
jgi:CRP/FNR family transcriptional regulator